MIGIVGIAMGMVAWGVVGAVIAMARSWRTPRQPKKNREWRHNRLGRWKRRHGQWSRR